MADQEAGRRDPARGRDRQVVRAQVHAVGAGGQCQIEPVVHEEEGARCPGEGAKAPRQGEQITRGQHLVAQLHCGRTGAQGSFHHIDHPARRGQPRVRDRDQAEPVCQPVRLLYLDAQRPRIRLIALLCSRSVRLKMWLPSGPATKYR